MRKTALLVPSLAAVLAACATTSEQGTLAELEQVPADVDEVYLEDSLELAAQSYRRYLEETSESALTPEALRRLADLQIEQEYGFIGRGEIVEMAAPDTSSAVSQIGNVQSASAPALPTESEREFERRATAQGPRPTAYCQSVKRHSTCREPTSRRSRPDR